MSKMSEMEETIREFIFGTIKILSRLFVDIDMGRRNIQFLHCNQLPVLILISGTHPYIAVTTTHIVLLLIWIKKLHDGLGISVVHRYTSKSFGAALPCPSVFGTERRCRMAGNTNAGGICGTARKSALPTTSHWTRSPRWCWRTSTDRHGSRNTAAPDICSF